MYSTSLVFEPPFPIRLASVVRPWVRGDRDPLARLSADGRCFWTSARVENTQIILRFEQEGSAAVRLEEGFMAPIRVQMWTPQGGSSLAAVEKLSEQIPAWLGAYDDWSAFLASPSWQLLPHSLVQAHRENPGLRLGANGQIFWQTVAAITEQRVTGIEAMGGLRAVLRHCAEPFAATGLADQPAGMLFFPAPEVLGQVPSWVWHRAGYDRARSDTVLAFARRARAIERAAESVGVAELASMLASVPGVGAWTVAEVLQKTHGHPDAISLGDYHLAKHVGWAFEGKRADDARMLDLLAPFAGNRGRVVALIKAAHIEAPKQGARLAPQDHRRH